MILDKFKIYMPFRIAHIKILYTKKEQLIAVPFSPTISQYKSFALLHQSKSSLSTLNELYLLRNTYHIHGQRNRLLDTPLSQLVPELFIIYITAFFREASIIIPWSVYRYRNKERLDIFLFKNI